MVIVVFSFLLLLCASANVTVLSDLFFVFPVLSSIGCVKTKHDASNFLKAA